MKKSVLIIYTGGTIGMVEDAESHALRPFDFNHIGEQVPELKKFGINIDTLFFKDPIDSSNMNPIYWNKIAEVIKENYTNHCGFVVLHGTDTMSFTASALSYMLEGLNKPVILTGSQLPIGTLRTDGKENLITAVEIAAAYENDMPVVPEVAIYFEFQLYRGNRTTKVSSEFFDAFASFNYPDLAQAGISINYNKQYIKQVDDDKLSIFTNLNSNVAVLKIFPGINQETVSAILSIQSLKGVVMETYGSGNATTEPWFIDELQKATDKGILIFNVTQCSTGSVNQGFYSTSASFDDLGIISGRDITFEAAITKMMYLFGKYQTKEEVVAGLRTSISGEMIELV
jgi:L-asparaginase